ncbi:Selenocysteine lyase/Cysteine desulfurase [Abditibacterium utsteinense]|uniref:Selenocysteine lyase/Cysteine desulfurase n=1 Tax=Abditibacterium utsteinense TaxID=1960156 RepID=A0A2S8STA6_9BACT|nr:aminotransferase class V-fold PLP-dependent enzyme [Abditibacterium utsteinense]PQV64033.1 Selenocysteine lyase/Cysteine desulfurase [Abditibacterium utsteinense]
MQIPTDSAKFHAWRREQFPFFERKICLTHASISPLPRRSSQAIANYAARLSNEGQFDYIHDAIYKNCKERIARMLGHGAKPEEIAFAGSTSHALGLVATSFPWQAGENCVVADGDFPANVIIWKNLKHTHNVECKIIPQRNEAMDLTLEDVLPLLDEKTRIVSLSAVHFLSGASLNLNEIGAELHRRGIKFCVDGIQALGAVQLDLEHVDFVCADAHKWLLGPNGAAFMWARSEVLETMRPQILGWLSTKERENWFSYDTTPFPTAERFEPGARNYLGIIGMESSLALLEEVGSSTIEARIIALRDYGSQKMKEAGAQLLFEPRKQDKSGIFSFRFAGRDIEELNRHLDEKFALSLRKDKQGEFVIRVSPHFMNCEGDLDELANAIRSH